LSPDETIFDWIQLEENSKKYEKGKTENELLKKEMEKFKQTMKSKSIY